MSTERVSSRRARSHARRRARFVGAFAVVLGGLALVAVGAGAAGLAQGPRVTDVQVDPAGAIAQSGSRVILTANQALAAVDDAQVTVEPATAHTVDATGRTVGVRFPTALDPETTYTVRVEGATGIGGGPSSALETTFTTPRAEVLALERDPDGPDAIRSVEIGAEGSSTVFEADAIDDFRSTSRFLVVSTVESDGSTRLVVVDRARPDAGAVEVPLPGEGTTATLQVSERGQLFGFTFTDADPSRDGARVSVLLTGSLREVFDGSSDAVSPVVVAGAEPSVDRWRFVPETSSLLLNDFDGDLTLVDREDPDAVTSFGVALGIEGIARSTYTAVIDRVEGGFAELDLASGEVRALDDIEHDGDVLLNAILPMADGATLRGYARMVDGLPAGMRVVSVAPDGSVVDAAEVAAGDALLQMCASPSAKFAALTVAPDAASNRYDRSAQPLPLEVETRIVEIDSGETVQTISGFDVSWCEVGPW